MSETNWDKIEREAKEARDRIKREASEANRDARGWWAKQDDATRDRVRAALWIAGIVAVVVIVNLVR